jgi:hypothetical protein
VLLIVELLTLWIGLSVVLGLPLGRAIRRADVREYPLRDSVWWADAAEDRRDRDLSTRRPRILPV